MNRLVRVWNRFEEGAIAFLLAAMTLVTFLYVVMTNVFTLFYDLGDRLPTLRAPLYSMGDAILGVAQDMSWSNALTKALFGWLIFLGIAYGVRTAGHLGVDALVRLAPRPLQRLIGILACLCCLGYAGLFMVASYDWVKTLFVAGIGAEDLDHFGILQAYIAVVVPVGFGLVLLRYLEILVNLLRGRQARLGLADRPPRPPNWPAKGRGEPSMTVLILFLLLFLFMFIGVPIAISLGLSGALTILLFSPDSVRSLAIKLFETSEAYTLLAIPFFLLSGAFMTTGGVARRLIDFANACVGHIRGGLAIAAVLACMLFAALSGSSPATVAAVGSIAVAGMVRSGYPRAFGAGIICNAGTLGILIPPSIVMVVCHRHRDLGGQAVRRRGGSGVVARGDPDGGDLHRRAGQSCRRSRASFREWLAAARRAGWGLLLLVIILGGIYSGLFTPPRRRRWRRCIRPSSRCLCTGHAPARLSQGAAGVGAAEHHADVHHRQCHALRPRVDHRADPQQITEWVVQEGLTPIGFLLMVNVVLLVAGASWSPRRSC